MRKISPFLLVGLFLLSVTTFSGVAKPSDTVYSDGRSRPVLTYIEVIDPANSIQLARRAGRSTFTRLRIERYQRQMRQQYQEELRRREKKVEAAWDSWELQNEFWAESHSGRSKHGLRPKLMLHGLSAEELSRRPVVPKSQLKIFYPAAVSTQKKAHEDVYSFDMVSLLPNNNRSAFVSVFKKPPTPGQLTELEAANTRLSSIQQPVSIKQAFESDKGFLIFVGHNVGGKFLTSAGKKIDMKDLANRCLLLAKFCFFITCDAARYVGKQGGAGIKIPITVSEAVTFVMKTSDYLEHRRNRRAMIDRPSRYFVSSVKGLEKVMNEGAGRSRFKYIFANPVAEEIYVLGAVVSDLDDEPWPLAYPSRVSGDEIQKFIQCVLSGSAESSWPDPNSFVYRKPKLLGEFRKAKPYESTTPMVKCFVQLKAYQRERGLERQPIIEIAPSVKSADEQWWKME